ncbi:hypothetical protein T06_3819, partial [Trichinella sp. T6]
LGLSNVVERKPSVCSTLHVAVAGDICESIPWSARGSPGTDMLFIARCCMVTDSLLMRLCAATRLRGTSASISARNSSSCVSRTHNSSASCSSLAVRFPPCRSLTEEPQFFAMTVGTYSEQFL